MIDPTDFTIAASGGDITGAQLSGNLAGINVTIQSSSGAQGTAGNINVNDVVTWSANKLTLNAQNNINLNANLNGSGGALLALEYGQGAVASGNTSTYKLANGVKVSLPEGNTFSTKLGSDGSTTNFYVITQLGAEGSSTTTDLQGMRAGVTGNYALGADIDASVTSTWQSGQGFTFIGTQGNVFSGNFEGLGHTIDNLFENWAVGYVGLIGKLDSTGRVGNLHLTNVNISGGLDNVGGLVGYNDKGTIEHVSVQGKINGGNNNLGGVIGFNDGTVLDAHANNVAVSGKNYATGGLIGKQSSNGSTTKSDSSGTIIGFYDVGGLIGSSSTDLDGLHSSATVNPSGGESGGLVGTGVFDNKNVGIAKPVTLTGIELNSTDAGNYKLLNPNVTASANITPRPLRVTANASDKIYDGNTSAQLTLGLNGLVTGDQAQISANSSFSDKNVGNNKTVRVTGVQISGLDLSNYSFNVNDFNLTASITPRVLTVALQGVVQKLSDGNAVATLNGGNYAISNLVAGESISIAQSTGEYDTPNAGSGKLVTVALSNGNYSAGANTQLSNYQLRIGNVSANVGTITLAAGQGSNVDSNNQGQLSGNDGSISLPQAFNGVLTTLPDTSVAATDTGRSPITVSNSGSTKVTSDNQQTAEPLAPAQPSAVSTNTRENLLFRRAFSIGDGSIRLPQGVRGSEKDASQ